MAINADWHGKNRMPKNPSLQQRAEWHISHEKNCNCRTMSEKMREEFKEYIKKRKK